MAFERRIMLAGTESGVGKTTITIGIMAALQARGLAVQGFKCGPDYIDPTFHTAVTGRPSRNVDSWMLTEDAMREIYIHGHDGADISIVEGMMGFYDGYDSSNNLGSSAHISSILECPVILIVNAQAMARSAAAIVKGFQLFSTDSSIAGVIVNRVGSEGHYHLLKQAIEQECQIPVVGYLTTATDIHLPERHLGLIPALERGDMDSLFQALARQIEASIDLDMLLECATCPPLKIKSKHLFTRSSAVIEPKQIQGMNPHEENGNDGQPKIRIAIAKDAAFHFYYPDNLDLLREHGAELIEFSPLADEEVPEGVTGLYLGGGFPEEFAATLSTCHSSKDSIKKAIEAGLPTVAECGGFMFLTQEIVTTDNHAFAMVGVLPGSVQMQSKLAAIGYREIAPEQGNYLLQEGQVIRGHEFHYSVYRPKQDSDSVHSNNSLPPAYCSKSLYGEQLEGIVYKNLIAGYTHIHFGSGPELIENWFKKCREWYKKYD